MEKTKPVPSKDPGRAMSTSSGPERAAEDSSVVAVNQWPSSGEQKVSEDDVKRLNRKRKASSLTQAFDDQVRPYIDLIDNLRAYGLDKDVGLPAVAVIGDQSSGKSSTLEAISGIQLPRGAGIVTRCPLELRMKCHRVDDKFWSAKISYKDKHGKLQNANISTLEDVESSVRAAQDAITDGGKGISDELITLEVTSPNVPDLTLIDLPGIARVAVGDQPGDIEGQIKSLIKRYIKRQETIILVVIPSNVDIATTEALQLSQQFDPEGQRSLDNFQNLQLALCSILSVLTKPDLIDKGTEVQVLKAVKNEVISLRKGYTIVKCRGQAALDKKQTLQDAARDEKAFFENHEIFREIPQQQRGISSLSKRLTRELVEQIKRVVPELKTEVKEKLQQTYQLLSPFGEGVPDTLEGRQAALVEVVFNFIACLSDAASGNYVTRDGDTASDFNLMAVMRRTFHSFGEEVKALAQDTDHQQLNFIEQQIEDHRGRELPNFNTYSVFEALVRDIVKKFTNPSLECLDRVDEWIGDILDALCEKSFARFPKIKDEVKAILCLLRRPAKDLCKEELYKQFDREHLVYSQDTTYLSELEMPSGKGVFPHRTIGNQTSALHVIYALKAYFLVCSRRVMDMVPMIIRHQMLEVLVGTIKSELTKFAANQENARQVVEDPERRIRRNQLRERKERLLRAEEILNRFNP